MTLHAATPSSTPPANAVQTIWCDLLVGSLVDAGVSLVVISPGSRSTPLVASLVAESSRHRSLSLVTIIDERAAAFYALGAARATHRPVALVCTSGTAGAHYLPAIIEASLSNTPLLAITADRPPELLDCGASQTIDQVHLFGRFVRHSFDLGPAASSQPALRALRRKIAQATTLALGPLAGPVHIEVPLRKPLEAIAPTSDEDRALSQFAHSLRGPLSIAPPSLAPDPSALIDLATAIAAEPDGIIVVGAMPTSFAQSRDALFALAERAGYPVIAESGSQLRFALNAHASNAHASNAHTSNAHASNAHASNGRGATRIDHIDLIPVAHRPAPRIVIQLGAEPVAASWSQWDLSRAQRWVLAPTWADPSSSARVILGAPALSIDALLAQIADRSAPNASFANAANASNAPDIAPSRASQQRIRTSAWLDTWRELDARAARTIERALADHPRSEGAAIRAAIASLPPGAIIQVGNSLPIRIVDQVCLSEAQSPEEPKGSDVQDGFERVSSLGPSGLWGASSGIDPNDRATPTDDPVVTRHKATRIEHRVITQRGAAGIDGLISSAAGATHAGPVLLVLGDVSFAHDVGGLLATRAARAPLAILVVDNRGGQIFAGLPVAKAGLAPEVVAEHWLTAPELDPAAVAHAMGVRAITAASPAAIASAIADALDTTTASNARTSTSHASTARVTVIHAPVSATGAHDVRRAALEMFAAPLEGARTGGLS